MTNDALSLVRYEVICLVPSQWWLTVNPNGQNVTDIYFSVAGLKIKIDSTKPTNINLDKILFLG